MWRWLALAGVVAVTALLPASGPPPAARTQPAAGMPAAGPERLRPEVLATYPHDTGAFTQGLELHDGLLYESTGQYGRSDVRVVEPETGKVRHRVPLPANAFGEGMTLVGERLWQLTWQEQYAFQRDRADLAELRQVPYAGEGWGVCHDPDRRRLVMSNGSADLTFRDPETFDPAGTVTVTLDGQPLTQLNELECVGDRVWANVWLTDRIVRIDPADGTVDAVVDAAGLLTPQEMAGVDVLNGIAAVPGADTFLITGKLWPKTFLVRFVPNDQ
jgi:glutaminyl-peptide cyclotransferase